MNLRSVDFVYKRRPYRLAENVRDTATVRPAEEALTCFTCRRPIREATRYVRPIVGLSLHPGCAIREGLLTEIPGIQRPGYEEGISWP